MSRHKKWIGFLLCFFFSVHAVWEKVPYNFETIKQKFVDMNAWGLHTIVDLKNCDPDLIRSKEHIHAYIIELCDLIDMKRFGDPTIIHFGEDERVAGYSMFQLIETSNIAGHFANDSNHAYIDIFSCKLYDPDVAVEFTKNFFKAEKAEASILFR